MVPALSSSFNCSSSFHLTLLFLFLFSLLSLLFWLDLLEIRIYLLAAVALIGFQECWLRCLMDPLLVCLLLRLLLLLDIELHNGKLFGFGGVQIVHQLVLVQARSYVINWICMTDNNSLTFVISSSNPVGSLYHFSLVFKRP